MILLCIFLILPNLQYGCTQERNLDWEMFDIDYNALLPIITDGLPITNSKKSYLIVGAGMAGLSTAELLKRAGHEVTILEGSSRVGGRVETYYDPLGWYGDVGAMQIMPEQLLVNHYIKRFNISMRPLEYSKGYYYFNGIRVGSEEANKNVSILDFKGLTAEEQTMAEEKGPYGILSDILEPLYQDQIKYGWDYVVQKYDKYSLHDYLQFYLSDAAVEMVESMIKHQGTRDCSILETVRGLGHNEVHNEHYQVVNGTNMIPQAFMPLLKENIRFNAKVVSVEQLPGKVVVKYINTKSTDIETLSADEVIVTVTAKATQLIDFIPPLSEEKMAALEVNYVPADKIFIYFSEPFWAADGFLGGGRSLTDGIIESVYYPNNNDTSNGGVVLASYCAGTRTTRLWNNYTDEQAIKIALEELSNLHQRDLSNLFVNAIMKRWEEDPYSHGGFADFFPEEEKLLYSQLTAPHDRVYFAGEHTSLLHGWIEGAIVSGLRAIQQSILPKQM